MMPVPWKLWEGQVVDLCFPLRRYLGGTDRSAVYLTQYGDVEPRNAAIKLVMAETAETDPSANWERAARLSHPNLLRLLRTGRWQVNQLPLRYVVTEYAEENLATVLAERPLTTGEVRDLLKPLLAALAYIHGEGLVHGHLKPANIMAVGDDLKLSVDGISLVGEPGSAPGATGPYDSPEFHDRGCSPVGDVWSFGVTLVEALTQQLPTLSGPKQELKLPESLPAEFQPMVRACLRPEPRRRASPRNILEQFGWSEPKAAEEPPPQPAPHLDEAPPATPRKWLNLALVGASAVALAGIVAGPRLLRYPAASAQTQQAVVVPASTAVSAHPEARQAAEPAVDRAADSSAERAPESAEESAAPSPAESKVESPVESKLQHTAAAPKASGTPTPAAAVQVASSPDTAPRPDTGVLAPAARTTPRAPDKRVADSLVEAPAGQVVHQVLPDVPEFARRTIHGVVKIQVRAIVDATGHVADAQVESQNSRYFAKLAVEAARQWDFAAAPSNWLLRFEFTTASTTVHPSRLSH